MKDVYSTPNTLGLWPMNLFKPSLALFLALAYTSIIYSKTIALGFLWAAHRGIDGEAQG